MTLLTCLLSWRPHSHLTEIFISRGAEASASSPSPTRRLSTGSCLSLPTAWTGRRSTPSTPPRSLRAKLTRPRRSSWAASVRRPRQRKWRRTSVSSVSSGAPEGFYLSHELFTFNYITREYSNYKATNTVSPPLNSQHELLCCQAERVLVAWPGLASRLCKILDWKYPRYHLPQPTTDNNIPSAR